MGWGKLWRFSHRRADIRSRLEIKTFTLYTWSPPGGPVDWGSALQAGKSGVLLLMVSLEFFVDIVHPAALWPWGRLIGTRDRCIGLTTSISCADFHMKFESLNLLEPQVLSRSVQGLFYLSIYFVYFLIFIFTLDEFVCNLTHTSSLWRKSGYTKLNTSYNIKSTPKRPLAMTWSPEKSYSNFPRKAYVR